MNASTLQWAWPVILAAVLAAAGWVGKTAYDWWDTRRQIHAGRLARLQQLDALLDTSRRVFEIQALHRERLLDALTERLPEKVDLDDGYDAAFARLHGELTEEEQELHGLIRAMTATAMRELNVAMSGWLKDDVDFKTQAVALSQGAVLSEQLRALDLHLALWHAKFRYWIPDKPQHALVYLGDEKQHGVEFPSEVTAAVRAAIAELQQRGPTFW